MEPQRSKSLHVPLTTPSTSSVRSLSAMECSPQLLSALMHCCAPGSVTADDSLCQQVSRKSSLRSRRSLPDRAVPPGTVRFAVPAAPERSSADAARPPVVPHAPSADYPQRSRSLPCGSRPSVFGSLAPQGRVLPAMRASPKLLAALMEFRSDSQASSGCSPPCTSATQHPKVQLADQPALRAWQDAAPLPLARQIPACSGASGSLVQREEQQSAAGTTGALPGCLPPPPSLQEKLARLNRSLSWHLSFSNTTAAQAPEADLPAPRAPAAPPQAPTEAMREPVRSPFDISSTAAAPAAPPCINHLQRHQASSRSLRGADLRFHNVQLEQRFKLYHNNVASPVDAAWASFSVCLGVVVCVGSLLQGKRAPVEEWWTCFVIPFLGMLLRAYAPDSYHRHREALWVCHAFCVMAGTSLPGSFVFKDPSSNRLLAYYFSGATVNAIGHKVRFHIQAATSLVLWGIMQLLMAGRTTWGMPPLTWGYRLAHTLSTAIVPAALVYFWDLRQRQRFLQTALAKAK